MKKFSLLILFFGILFTTSAQYQMLIQRGNVAMTFTSIDSVFANVQNNDTVYLPKGSFSSPAYKLVLNKKVHFFGGGYYKGINDSIMITTINSDLYLNDGADESSFEGIKFSQYVRFGESEELADVDNVSFKRCKFHATITLGYNANVQNVQFNECIFLGWIEGKNASYLSFRNSYFSGQLRSTAGNVLVDHCIIGGQFNSNTNLTVSNCIVPYGAGVFSTSTVQIINCAFTEINPDNYFGNSHTQVANNCIGPILLTETFLQAEEVDGYNSHSDYRLQEGSPCKTLNAGEEIGVYGGSNAFKHNRLPGNPQIKSSNIAIETDANGMLNIQFEVEAQEN